ncbi:MAG: hypothetical protein ACI4MS_06185 [Candidatus Coproplasma sp.]
MEERNQEGFEKVDYDDNNYYEYKKQNRIKTAKATILKIEYDYLSPNSDKFALKELCKSANNISLGAIVVPPALVKQCVGYLGKDPQVSLISAISYPHGMDTTDVKVSAVKRAVKDGVDEVEVCAPTVFIRDGNWTYIKKEFKKLKRAVKIRELRIVIDCAYLNEKDIVKCCNIASDAGVSCIRLINSYADMVMTVKNGLKNKCFIKAGKVESEIEFQDYVEMGSDFVNCKNALEFASMLLKRAEE